VIELSATSVVVVVTATDTINNITVNVDDILFTVTNVDTVFSITNVVNDITVFSDTAGGFDFVEQNKGPWVSGTEYLRNDVVDYNKSLYICGVPFRTVFTSTVAPPSDTTNWELFYFHEATMAYLTVTTTATIGGPVYITNTTGNYTPTLNPDYSLVVENGAYIKTDLVVDNRIVANLANLGPTRFSDTVGTYTLVQIDGNTLINGSARLTGVFTASNRIVSNAGTSSFASLQVSNLDGPTTLQGDMTITESLEVLGPLYVGGSVNVAGERIEGNIFTATNLVYSNTGTSSFYNATIRNQFQVGALRYPLTAGVNGQVLVTNGTNQASWTNLGDIQFWQLSDDLKTIGFYIVTGYEAGVANPELKVGSGSRAAGLKSHIWFKEVAQSTAVGDVEIKADQLDITNDVDIGGSVYVSGGLTAGGLTSYDDIIINGGKAIKGGVTGTSYFRVLPGIEFPDGTRMNTAAIGTGTGTVSLPIASSTVLGGIKVGNFLEINSTTGVLSVQTGSFLSTTTIATTASLGSIRVGDYLDIDPGTGILSVNTTSLGTIAYTLPIATTSTLGGIKVGQFLDIDTATGVLSVNTVSIGQVSYSLPVATTSTLGGIKVGSGLSIDAGTGVLSATTSGNISLTEDMETNGFYIRRSALYPDANILLSPNATSISSNASTSITLQTDDITLSADDFIYLSSPYVRVGSAINTSRLHVSRIYSYSGVGAPFFPAGIQFGDQTVQLTAYYSNDFGPVQATSIAGIEQQARVVDFNNPTLSVDYNLV